MSTEPTTEMMNEVIALFMGLTPRLVQPPDPALHCIEVWYNNESQSMKYHTSWDWIVPVCKKIKSIKFNNMNTLMLSMGAMAEMNNGLVSLDLERTHKGAFQFLTWFNQQKQTNE